MQECVGVGLGDGDGEGLGDGDGEGLPATVAEITYLEKPNVVPSAEVISNPVLSCSRIIGPVLINPPASSQRSPAQTSIVPDFCWEQVPFETGS